LDEIIRHLRILNRRLTSPEGGDGTGRESATADEDVGAWIVKWLCYGKLEEHRIPTTAKTVN
jgi:hypothetical protein